MDGSGVGPKELGMLKGYICRWEPDPDPTQNRHIYYFCESPKDAFSWDDRYLAEVALMEVNRGVTIPSGGTFVCRDFQIEEDGEGRFVIWCEAPFAPFDWSLRRMAE
jgi:hypothetical protein